MKKLLIFIIIAVFLGVVNYSWAITGVKNIDLNPVWSPDGSKIAFFTQMAISNNMAFIKSYNGWLYAIEWKEI